MLSNILCTNQQISEEKASFNYKQIDTDEVQTFGNKTYSREFILADIAMMYSPIRLSKKVNVAVGHKYTAYSREFDIVILL